MTIEIYIARDRLAEYEALKNSARSEDQRIFSMLEKAADLLKENPYVGDRIRRQQIPKEYHQRYSPLENLWKYNLSKSWRLIYTIASQDGVIVVVLEWFSHNEYERRFNY